MRKFILVSLILFLFSPVFCFARPETQTNKVYRAKVVEVLKQQKNVLPSGVEAQQQELKLLGLEGEIKDRNIFFYGIGNLDVVGQNIYKVGDKVLVVASSDAEGNTEYYITDYVRSAGLFWLAAIFLATIVAVGKFKGARSVLSLALTFLVITKYIVPQILFGANPIFVSLFGSLIILVVIIYLTEGFRKEAHIAFASIFFSLLFTVFLSQAFIAICHLTGIAGEEEGFLVDIIGRAIDFRGLLLAGMIIGTLGVLDDVVIAQIAAVKELHSADGYLSKKELFKKSSRIGIAHISSMTNTLFLAYAGVSLPLLILFLSGDSAFATWGQTVNNESVATEIVRTLVGSIGLILSVPISTALAVWQFKK